MATLGYHVTIRLEDDRSIATTAASAPGPKGDANLPTPERCRDGISAAAGLADIAGQTEHSLLAKKAGARVLLPNLKTASVADVLQTSPRNLQRLRNRQVAPELIRAVEFQLGLRWLQDLAGPNQPLTTT